MTWDLLQTSGLDLRLEMSYSLHKPERKDSKLVMSLGTLDTNMSLRTLAFGFGRQLFMFTNIF